MMHTQGKWTTYQDPDDSWAIDSSGINIASIWHEANAKRICMMNNSHEGLVEACKDVLSGINVVRESHAEHDVPLKWASEQLEQAIAKAGG